MIFGISLIVSVLILSSLALYFFLKEVVNFSYKIGSTSYGKDNTANFSGYYSVQKLKDNSEIQLIDFDNDVELIYPLQHIKRGGGLTFHYPGQFVFYPIINLTFHKIGVHDFMSMIMDLSKSLLEDMFNIYHFKKRNDLLGLWFDNSEYLAKVASIGFAVSRFNTYHGMALNFFNDKEMFEALRELHPCGIPGSIYLDIESIYQDRLTLADREIFATNFEKAIVSKLVKQKLSKEDNFRDNNI